MATVSIYVGPWPGEVLRLQHGDVLVLRMSSNQRLADIKGQLDSLVSAINTVAGPDVIVAAVLDDGQITLLDEDAMRAHGWVRADGDR